MYVALQAFDCVQSVRGKQKGVFCRAGVVPVRGSYL